VKSVEATTIPLLVLKAEVHLDHTVRNLDTKPSRHIGRAPNYSSAMTVLEKLNCPYSGSISAQRGSIDGGSLRPFNVGPGSAMGLNRSRGRPSV
jgi:hypothetical protein